MDEKFIPHELLVYSPGNETRNAGFYPDEILDDVENLDAKIYSHLKDNYGFDENCELDEDAEKQLRQGIIAYINDLKCTMTIRYALRRYICNTFGKYDEQQDKYLFELEDNGKIFTVSVGNYAQEDYELSDEDLETYVVIWKSICSKYNTCSEKEYNLVCTTSEIKRYIRDTEVCKRDTMFRIAFALHMDNNITVQFLTNVLADRGYNYRVPQEIIYHFCQSHPEYNSFCKAKEFIDKYNKTIKDAGTAVTENYTGKAVWTMETGITTPDQLFAFLEQYQPNFDGSSRTIYNNFMNLYNAALDCAQCMNPGSDEQIDNPEALAKEIFACIPRTYRKGSQEGDFVKINANTSSLYSGVLNSALLSDRMRKIIKGSVTAQKKDLIILYFYIFCTQIELKGGKCIYNYETFRLEMNAILMECGMSGLYALNRFDNLVMLSFWSVNPYEFFGDIVNESFDEQ